MICAFFLAQVHIHAQNLGDSIKSDTTSYKIVQDSIDWNTRSTVVGDGIGMPIEIGEKSSDFSYTNTQNTTLFSSLYTGRSTNDVFYRFTLTVPMNVTMTHQGSGVSDTYMYLLDHNGNLIVSNDDYNGEGHCSNTYHSFIRRQLAAGTYFVVSEGYSSNGNITTNITGNASAGYNYPSIPSSYSTEPGTAVGGMGGQFSVSAMGGATYSIPIEVPQGVGGLQPQLSIVYNSQSGNGLCGFGANLSGISAITRGPKDIYHDGAAKGISYLADDALYLDGVRLILSSGAAGQNNAVYHPESDPFTTVTAKVTGSSPGNSLWFEVKSSDGMTFLYGADTYSKLTYGPSGAQKTHSWYMSRAIQPTGNYIDYYYQQEHNCIYPALIAYGTNTSQMSQLSNVITFTYVTRQDSIPVVFDGQQGSMKRLLKTVTCSTNDNTYRLYTLNYDSVSDGTAYKFSRLTSVTEKNGQSESLPSTRLDWSYLPAVSYVANSVTMSQPSLPNPFVSFPFSDQNYLSGDFNGDGLTDIVGMAQEGEPNNQGGYDYHTYVYIYCASLSSAGALQYLSGTSFVLPPNIESGRIKAGVNALFVIDVNGDGINELAVPYFVAGSSNGVLGLYVLGLDFAVGDGGGAIGLHGNAKPLFVSGDINNDGRTDVAFMETTQYGGSYPLYIWKYNTGYIPGSSILEHGLFDMNTELSLSLSSMPKTIYLSDMNGNGLNDLFVICADGYAVFWNQGDEVNGGSFSDSYKSTGSIVKDARSLTPGDFNGDGLLDLLSNSGSDDWYFLYNNGDGTFSQAFVFSNSMLADQSFTDYDDNRIICNVVDFDGNGISDAVITKADYLRRQDTFLGIPIGNPWGEFQKVHTYWMCTSGNSMIETYHATSVREADATVGRYLTGDFNGDGQIELINFGNDCVNGVDANYDASWHIYNNSVFTAQTGKVTSITGDYGVVTNITYSSLTDNTVYTRGNSEQYPAPRYTIPINVLKQTVQNNGAAGSLTTQYAYEGLKAHLQGRGLLGFCKTTANCTTTGVISESGITQWDTVFYIPKVTYSKTTIGNSYAQTTNTLTITDKGQKKYFAYPSQTVATDMDGNTVTTVRSYNTTYGYPESETATYGTDMYSSTSYSDYTLAGGAYLPQTVTSTQRHQDDTSPFNITTTYTYNGTTGTMASKVENYGTSKPLTTSYTYDAFGNLTSQLSTGSGITNCTTYYTYDQTHRFPIRIYTNPASSVMKYTYDIFGNVLTERDSINSSISNTISHTYDAWGQLIRTDMPDGTSTTYNRGWNNDTSKRYFILTQGTATPWVKTWYDNQGREVMTESIGPMNVSVTSSTSYNSKGLATSHTENNGNLSLTHNYTYDSRGRVATESYTGGRTLSYQYGNRSMTMTENENENSTRNTTTTYDAWGNVKTVTDPISSISNTYSSNGAIKQAIAGGATWTFGYDDRGNRTSMADPDAGTTTYVYDALGRETKRTDARNVVFETKYDYLGRVIQRKAGTDSISYTYGASGNGHMSLTCEIKGPWSKSYTYDNLRRVTSETMTDGTVTKTKTYQYGMNGLPSESTVPGGKVYEYTYDAYGNLIGVDFETGTVEWSLTEYTGKQTISETVIDNDSDYPFTRETTLDDNGLLYYVRTLQDDNDYQTTLYEFSPENGNLTWVMHASPYDAPYEYSYDNADRLTGVEWDGHSTKAFTYSANGNITSKTGIGSYEYGTTTRPHAVTAVDNTSGIINMNDQTVSYNTWNKVSSVSQTDNSSTYNHSIVYGPDLQRVISVTTMNNSTLYEKFYWDDYEERKVGNDLYQYYYVSGSDGLAGLHVVKTSPNNQVTTHTTKVITDHLGSIIELRESRYWRASYSANYDEWGKRSVYRSYSFDPYFDRGYTGHEHLLNEFGLINMNGRMYDPNLGRFLSPDNYIQSPYNSQNYNRYSYCLNNPLKYTDPSGESIVGAIIFGAIIGTYSGGVLANEGNFDPTMWEWQSGKTWGYMAGGMITGALSGAVGAAIASSGIPMANTLSIMGGSLTNSLGTYAYSGGQTDITMSFGFASYNFTQKTFGAIWDKNNTTLDYICYSLGLLANVSDVLVGKNPGDVSLRTENDPNNHKIQAVYDGDGNIIGYEDAPFKDLTGHTQIVDMDGKTLVDWGPSNRESWSPGTNSYEGGPIPATKMKWGPVTIKGANVNRISNWNPSGRYNLLFNNCVQQASRALNAAGVFNVGIHPYLLHAQMYLRSVGVRPFLFSYYGI